MDHKLLMLLMIVTHFNSYFVCFEAFSQTFYPDLKYLDKKGVFHHRHSLANADLLQIFFIIKGQVTKTSLEVSDYNHIVFNFGKSTCVER